MYLKKVSHTIQHKMKLNIQQRICKKYMSNEMQLKQKEEKLFCFSCQHKAQVEGK
jgi:DNA-binding cell septation regulator SpoVG